jgi:nucleoside-diphosphate-sugar epimerase
MREDSTTQANLFDKVNVAGTINLARQAVRAGVTRLIFISSIKVNGEETEKGRSFSAADAPTPVDAYGQSKLAAENGLRAVSAETGLEVVIIRPVLVYGPGVKANFRSMMRWIERGIPLPLGAIKNARSLVAIDNLVDLIVTCLDHPSAPGEVFLVSDGEDLSTPQLLGRMGAAMKRPVRLLSVPLPLLSAAAILFGRTAYIKRLCGSLQVDIEKTRRVLGWSPPVSVDAALQMVARDVVEARSTAPMAMSNSGLQGPRG